VRHTSLPSDRPKPFIGLPLLIPSAASPQTPQSTAFISHLTNSNGCGNLQVKVLLTVSPFSPPFPPQSDVYPKAQYCLSSLPTTHYPPLTGQLLYFQNRPHARVSSPASHPRLLHLCVSVSLWQTPCSQYFAASLASPKKSTPLQSSKSSLFLQNTRGGGIPENPSFGINNIQPLFLRSCLLFSYERRLCSGMLQWFWV